MSDGEFEGCGWEYDLRLIHESDDGGKTWECRECGAEIIEEAE